MNLETICAKLEAILNGTDPETAEGIAPANGSYFFKVFSEGVYLTQLFDMESGKNFIPVVVGALGGSHNPVKGLGQVDYNVNVGFYFPVRFKSDFYALADYLAECFVGASLTYGGQKAVSNISVTQFGELENVDMREFAKWVENSYKMPIDVMEAYMSMSFTLFLSTSKGYGQEGGFLYGNEWTTKISMAMPRTETIIGAEINALGVSLSTLQIPNKPRQGTIVVSVPRLVDQEGETIYEAPPVRSYSARVFGGDTVITISFIGSFQGARPEMVIGYIDDEYFKDDEPNYIETGDASSSVPAAQQLLGEKRVKGIAANTSYTKTLPIYVKANQYYANLVKAYLAREIQNAEVTITEGCPGLLGTEGSARAYYVANMAIAKAKGQLMSITLTLAEKA